MNVDLRDPDLSFFVSGRPVPQGSKRAFFSPKSKRVIMTEAAGERHASWRAEVKAGAALAMEKQQEPVDGALHPNPWPHAVAVDLTFYQYRPLSHYGTGRNKQNVKSGQPMWPDRAPDIDKLTRAVLDSMTGTVFVDDGQVVRLRATKRYRDRYAAPVEGVAVQVWVL